MRAGEVYKIRKEFLKSIHLDKRMTYCRIDFIDKNGCADVVFSPSKRETFVKLLFAPALYESVIDQFYSFVYREAEPEGNRLKRVE